MREFSKEVSHRLQSFIVVRLKELSVYNNVWHDLIAKRYAGKLAYIPHPIVESDAVILDADGHGVCVLTSLIVPAPSSSNFNLSRCSFYANPAHQAHTVTIARGHVQAGNSALVAKGKSVAFL